MLILKSRSANHGCPRFKKKLEMTRRRDQNGRLFVGVMEQSRNETKGWIKWWARGPDQLSLILADLVSATKGRRVDQHHAKSTNK